MKKRYRAAPRAGSPPSARRTPQTKEGLQPNPQKALRSAGEQLRCCEEPEQPPTRPAPALGQEPGSGEPTPEAQYRAVVDQLQAYRCEETATWEQGGPEVAARLLARVDDMRHQLVIASLRGVDVDSLWAQLDSAEERLMERERRAAG